MVDLAVEEILPYEPSVPFTLRVAVAEILIGGQQIRCGTRAGRGANCDQHGAAAPPTAPPARRGA